MIVPALLCPVTGKRMPVRNISRHGQDIFRCLFISKPVLVRVSKSAKHSRVFKLLENLKSCLRGLRLPKVLMGASMILVRDADNPRLLYQTLQSKWMDISITV